MIISIKKGGEKHAEKDHFSQKGNFKKESHDVWRSHNLLSLTSFQHRQKGRKGSPFVLVWLNE